MIDKKINSLIRNVIVSFSIPSYSELIDIDIYDGDIVVLYDKKEILLEYNNKIINILVLSKYDIPNSNIPSCLKFYKTTKSSTMVLDTSNYNTNSLSIKGDLIEDVYYIFAEVIKPIEELRDDKLNDLIKS